MALASWILVEMLHAHVTAVKNLNDAVLNSLGLHRHWVKLGDSTVTMTA
jgi:hypothetical protein